jgi:hypothetical protein
MSLQRKPSIVFVHGLWADGSCFSKLVPTLQKEGFEAIASQHGLDSHAGDVDCVKRTLGRVHAAAKCDGGKAAESQRPFRPRQETEPATERL